VYLRAGPDALVARLDGRDDRPLLAGLDRAGRRARLVDLLAAREAAYASAAFAVDTDDRPIDAVVDAVCEGIATAADGASG